MNPVDLSLFASRLAAICEEIGAMLRDAALSPNIRDRLDFSCAIFDAQGQLAAQAAHIPVHLGSMAFAMADLVGRFDWRPKSMLILNDPFLGGTHLPDLTLVAPFHQGERLLGFLVNRAHHADIGASAPGSMPLSTHIDQEGLLLAPQFLLWDDQPQAPLWERIRAATSHPDAMTGDLSAQIAANRTGIGRLGELLASAGTGSFLAGLAALNDYGERAARAALADMPNGRFEFTDWLDDDGQGHEDLPIRVRLTMQNGDLLVDFTGSAPQVPGNLNCPLAVTAAAVYYVFRCLMPERIPTCAGIFRPIRLTVPAGCLLNAGYPAAVAAGNVETSSRVVDALLGALAQALPERIPAASQGSMNNLALGSRAAGHAWDYYETLGGGMGAGPQGGGLSGVQTHMTNTLNTSIETLETRFPLRITRYQLRRGSGGGGQRPGGDGLIREFEILAPAQATLLSERRRHPPWGLACGQPGAPGVNLVNGQALPAKVSLTLQPGDRLRIETPGGGGHGTLSQT